MTALAPCTSCLDTFQTQDEFRDHFKSDRHTYNVKRRQQNLKPITEELWVQKLKDFAGQAKKENGKIKGTAHLKKREPKSKHPSIVFVESEVLSLADRTECDCLFDDTRLSSIEENLTFMQKNYSFFVPHKEYLVKPKELILYLHAKIYEGFTCLYCDKTFQDSGSVLRHMLDKGHTRIGTENYTRKGNFSSAGTQELLAQLEPFYDFSGSIKELNPRKAITPEVLQAITDKVESEPDEISKEEKLKTLFDFFDEDEDGLLNQTETGNLYAHSLGEGPETELTAEKYQKVLAWLGTPQGITLNGMAEIYEELGNLDNDYDALDDWVDLESEFDVKECKDEAEFEKVMKELGLEKAHITDTGDLKLPTGRLAAPRELRYIYRQRGRRLTDEERRAKCKEVADGSVRQPLMIGNGRTGTCQIAVSRREIQRTGKQVIAVLRHEQRSERRRGEKQNIIQKRRMGKFNSILGDAAGGR